MKKEFLKIQIRNTDQKKPRSVLLDAAADECRQRKTLPGTALYVGRS